MTRRWRSAQGTLLGATLLLACPSDPHTDGSRDVAGDWWVDFGNAPGGLRLEEGRVVAFCYGPDATLGGYTVWEGWLVLTIDFNDGAGERLLSGPITERGEAGFEVELTALAPGSKIVFSPYTGDCSEAAGR